MILLSDYSIILLDQIIEENITRLGLNHSNLIDVSFYEDGLKISQENIIADEKINLNKYPEKYPLDLNELQKLLEIVIENKNKNGFNLRIDS